MSDAGANGSRFADACTVLFVPGDRPERFPKAAASGADVVVIDLEDAVAPAHKETARQAARTWLASPDAARGPVAWAVRVNAVTTEWHAVDVRALAGRADVAVMLPKSEESQAVAALAAAGHPVIALVETAVGITRAQDLAATEGVVRLALGHLDLAVDLGCEPDDEAMAFSRGALVVASRAAGLTGPIDGVSTEVRDADLVSAQARRSRALGFAGKLCIHPAQVDAVSRAFHPSDTEIAWARTIAEASHGQAVAVVDGTMVDAPVIARANAILARADRAGKPTTDTEETR